jgi:effector-binding domain-containing protein
MTPKVVIEEFEARPMAAVFERVPPGKVGARFREHLDKVYAFLAARPELRKPGAHNIFFYRHEEPKLDDLLAVEFCVEVANAFDGTGEVFCSWLPPGKVATAVHIGPYEKLHETHAAVTAWIKANGRRTGNASWEIYGDWTDDPAKLETKVCYLLK